MSKFVRGIVVYHKVLGKGIALNVLDSGKIEVRTDTGQIEQYYPEELEAEEELNKRNKNEITDDRNWHIGQ